MPVGQRGVQDVGQQRAAEEARVVGGRDALGLHRQHGVQLVLAQRQEAVRRLGLLDAHTHPGGAVGQQRGGRQNQAGQRRGKPADAQLPGVAGDVGVEVGPQQLQLGEQRVAMGQQHARDGRQAHAAAVGLQQRLAHLALQRGQLLGDRRGRQVQRVGRRRDRAAVGELAQRAQAAQVDHAAQLTGRGHKVHSFCTNARATLRECPAATSPSPPP